MYIVCMYYVIIVAELNLVDLLLICQTANSNYKFHTNIHICVFPAIRLCSDLIMVYGCTVLCKLEAHRIVVKSQSHYADICKPTIATSTV